MTHILAVRKARDGYAAVHVLTLQEGAGAPHEREVVRFGDSACVLPYDPERRVALVVTLPRAPLVFMGVEAQLIEAPAGMIEVGENAEATILREAVEEVGLVLGALEPIAVCWPSPGVLAERSHLFLAPFAEKDRVGAGGGLVEEHEGIVARELPLAELWGLARRGELEDLKTFALVLALKARRPELFLMSNGTH